MPLPLHACDFEVCVKAESLGALLTEPAFRWHVRYLMVLPLLPQHRIRPVFRKLQALVQNDNDLVSVYGYFHDTWITGFPIELWCQNMSQFRTNNFAESFHASLSRRDVPCHPAFYTFLKRIIRIIQESKGELEVERQNPKTRRRAKECWDESRDVD